MKVLQVSTVSTTIESFLIPYARSLKSNGFIVDACAEGANKRPKITANHDHVYEVDFCRNPLRIIKLIRSFWEIRRLLKKNSYDVVHVHTPIASFLTRIAAIGISNTRLFYTAHGFHYHPSNSYWKNILFYIAEKLVSFRTDHLFVINKNDYDFAINKLKLSSGRVTFLDGIGVDPENYAYNPVLAENIREELGISNDSFMLLQVAELNANKDHRQVFQALHHLIKKYPEFNITYVLAGEGPLRGELENLARALGLDNCIVFLGYTTRVKELMSACDSLVLSSKREGLPRCILEAMCAKKSVIASDIRGCRDLLESGSGLLVSQADIKDWADKIHTLYSSSQLRSEMGSKGYQLICDRYQQDKVVPVVINVYKKWLHREKSI